MKKLAVSLAAICPLRLRRVTHQFSGLKDDMDTMKITTNRNQYGVGQGCFHTQRISVSYPEVSGSVNYRFVYDCGSDTGASKKKLSPPLKWAIEHFSGSNNRPKAPLIIDTFYLSHFHSDHISGLARLIELTEIKEIVVPHVSEQLFASIVARFLALGDIEESTEETLRYLKLIEGLASGHIPGIEIPIVRIPFGEVDSNMFDDRADFGLWNPPNDLGENAKLVITPSWTSDAKIAKRLNMSFGTSSAHSVEFWELVTWAYGEHADVTNAVVDKLSAIKDAAGRPILGDLISGRINDEEIRWAIKNLREIQKAYADGLTSAGVGDVNNHNSVSLCLYSGPMLCPSSLEYRTSLGNYRKRSCYGSYCYENKRPYLRGKCHMRWVDRHGWLATGDAQLEKDPAWTSFRSHFGCRLEYSCTVLMPHHGSSKGENYNPELIQGSKVNAVFSAGSENQWHHPNREVLESVSEKCSMPIIVTELVQPGFLEAVVYLYDSKVCAALRRSY